MSRETLDEALIRSFWQKDPGRADGAGGTTTVDIPQPMQDKLEETELRALVYRLATRVEGRRAGVNVAKIVFALMEDAPRSGSESSALYQALREAVRRRIEAMHDMHFIQGLF
jgi:hypothetical protein